MEIILIIFIPISFVLGFLIRGLIYKSSGRLVINEEADEFFVAITDKPEDLAKHKTIILNVFVTKGRSK